MARYRLYLDESGDHTVLGVRPSDHDKRHLGLFGCALDLDYCHSMFCPALDAFKEAHLGKDPDDPVILHLETIHAKRDCFKVLQKKERWDTFWSDFYVLSKNCHFVCFAVLIDKISTRSKHYGPVSTHPYHVGLLTMLERYCGFLKFGRHQGDVMAESRGGKEDTLLKAAYESVYKGGTLYRPKEFFQGSLTSKELKIKKKESNVAGLQLADMFALPARKRMLADVKRGTDPKFHFKELSDIAETKYNARYLTGRTEGYGKIYIL